MSGPIQHCAILSIELCSDRSRAVAAVAGNHQTGQDFIAAAAATRLKGDILRSGPASFTARLTLADAAFSTAITVLHMALRQGLEARAGMHYGTVADNDSRPYDHPLLKRVMHGP